MDRYHGLTRLTSLVALLLLLVVPAAAAPGTDPVSNPTPAAGAPEKIEPPQEIGVSIYLLGIRDFDPRNGSFIADLYLNLSCLNGTPCDPNHFEFTNGSILYEEDISTPETLAEHYYTYRIQARLYTPLDFRRFPFDQQRLLLRLEDKQRDRTKVIFRTLDDETAVDGELEVPGWETGAPRWSVDEHYYVTWDEYYSRYNFELVLQRPPFSAVLKGLLPATLVALVAFFSLFTTVSKVVNRLTLLTSTFIAGVLLHLNTTNALPAVSYLTFADGFMLGNYVAIVLSLGATVWKLGLADGPAPERAEILNRRIRWIVPLLWLCFQAVNAAILMK